jgi:hypothetical protein
MFKVTSPISGFSGVLTSNQFTISPAAGSKPPPVNASITPAGIAIFGIPNAASLPLAVAPNTIIALTSIATVVDTIGLLFCIPPTLAALVGSLTPTIISKTTLG